MFEQFERDEAARKAKLADQVTEGLKLVDRFSSCSELNNTLTSSQLPQAGGI